jgi:hypothetical protein
VKIRSRSWSTNVVRITNATGDGRELLTPINKQLSRFRERHNLTLWESGKGQGSHGIVPGWDRRPQKMGSAVILV